MTRKVLVKNLESRVLHLLREAVPWQLGKTDITRDMTLHGNLGLDSLARMALLFRLEEEFDIDLIASAERFVNVRTVDDLFSAMKELVP
jgi:acyl carrier protein